LGAIVKIAQNFKILRIIRYFKELNMEKLYITFAIVFVLSVISLRFPQTRLKNLMEKISVPWHKDPYRLNDRFITPAELHFYQCLQEAAEGIAIVCPKVALQDVFNVDKGIEMAWGLRQKINKKHVDFLLCEPKKLLPIAGVELDDRTHVEEPARIKRDNFVNQLFHSARLPLLRIPARREYDVNEIKNSILQTLHADNTAPTCPDCEIPLTLKKNYKNQNYWGCSNYPHCTQSEDYANIAIEENEAEHMEPLTEIEILE